jgi:spermidine/putrescine transport system substrate-binding protein
MTAEGATSDEGQATTDEGASGRSGDGGAPADRARRAGRREFLAASGTTAAFAVAGCIGGGGGGPLTVSTWSGTNEGIFRETIKPMYEERTGNDLEVVGNWTNILGQLRQSPEDDPPFDLTIASVRDHYLGEQDGLWEPIREGNVPNISAVKPALLEITQSDSSVPVDYGVMGYAYNEDAVAAEPEAWEDLVTEGTPEKFALPATYFLNAMIMAAIVADEAPGAGELYSQDDRDIDAIFETMGEMPVAKFYQGAEDMWTAIEQGVANAGQYFYAYSVAKADEASGTNIGVHVPDRTLGYVDHYQVARGTSSRQQAEEFINFLLDEEVQTAYAEAFNLGMANENADHPDRTTAEVPIENDEINDEVVFKTYYRIAEAAPDIDERFKEFQGRSQS